MKVTHPGAAALRRPIRGTTDLETLLAYATDSGNLRLQISDLMEEQAAARPPAPAEKPSAGAEPEIVRL
jgi:hypothetical protein